MEDRNDKIVGFTLRNYQEGRFDEKQAYSKLKKRTCGRSLAGWRPALLSVTSAAAVIAVIAVLLYHPGQRGITTFTADSAARTVILPDKSEIKLSPGASLSFRKKNFGEAARSIKADGKIFCSITRDEEHPFEITAGESFIRVLGTKFQIISSDSLTTVDVISGKVLFSAKDNKKHGVTMTRGMSAILYEDTETPVTTTPACLNPAVWATNIFDYHNAPIDSVLAELSAFYGNGLHSENHEKRLTGEFKTGNIDETISLIESALDIKIDKEAVLTNNPHNNIQ